VIVEAVRVADFFTMKLIKSMKIKQQLECQSRSAMLFTIIFTTASSLSSACIVNRVFLLQRGQGQRWRGWQEKIRV